MSSTNLTPDNSKLFRPKGWATLVGVAALLILYFVLFFDTHLKNHFEQRATQVYGARISIGQLKTSLLNQTLSIKKVQVTNPYTPMKNLLEIETIEMAFSFNELLKKKILVPELKVRGIHTGTQRETSGIVFADQEYLTQPVSFLDRANAGLRTNLRSQLEQNPFKHLAPIATGFTFSNKLSDYQKDFTSLKDLKSLKTELDSFVRDWAAQAQEAPTTSQLAEWKESLAAALPQPESFQTGRTAKAPLIFHGIGELQTQKKKLSASLMKIETELQAIKQRMNPSDTSLKRDLSFIKTKLNLPSVEATDLSSALFGPFLLNALEKISYWSNALRVNMPVGTEAGGIQVVIQSRSGGNSFHFGIAEKFPSLLVQHATIESSLDTTPTRGSVHGTIEGYTVDPSIFGAPTSIHLEADFPNKEVQGLVLDLNVDHTGAVPKEEFTLKLHSVPIANWGLTKSPDFKLELAKAQASVATHGVLDGDKINVHWNLKFTDPNYEIHSRYSQVETTLKQIFQGTGNFEVSGSATGTDYDLAFQAESELGKQLGLGIAQAFKHHIASIDDNLKSRLMDELSPQRQELMDKIEDSETKDIAKMRTTLSELESLEKSADKLSALRNVVKDTESRSVSQRTRKLRLRTPAK